jgi:protein ImuA
MPQNPPAKPAPEDLLPDHLSPHLWRGHRISAGAIKGWASGHPTLDAELPGGGWPMQSLTEILQTPHACAAWRLLAPALSRLTQAGGAVFLIGPPQQPHLPGLAQRGLPAHQLFWVRCDTLADRLWATEQALKTRAVSAVLSWLPQARPEHMRRLHACASRHQGLLFALRPASAAQEASAAPLRLLVHVDPRHAGLQIEILKRRGPVLNRLLALTPPDLPGLDTLRVAPADTVVPTPSEQSVSLSGSAMTETNHALLDRLVLG